jgi:FMN-dependent oxidoreductase (nitrilotriacetate monooxygenase family)
MPRVLRLNAFEMASVGHIAHGLWTHPRDRSTHYADLDHWVELARTLERGKFDGLFLADVSGVYDLYKGGPETAIRSAIQIPILDPLLLVPAMAAATKHLGFGVTANLSHEQPYLFARRFSTLDHLTKGRIAWNIVTGFLDSSARGVGLKQQSQHDDRYDRADEFMEVVSKLWERSWDDDAVVEDRARRVYAEPSRVRPVRHEGRYYSLDAIHLSAPSPQRTPVLFQAGASARGLEFAARHGECVFLPGAKSDGAATTRALRRRIATAGRAPESALTFGSLQVVVGRTDREARDKFEDYRRYAEPEAGLAQFSSAIGVDLARLDPDEPLAEIKGDGIRSLAQGLQGGDGWTVRKLKNSMTLGGRFTPLVGDPHTIADEMALTSEALDLDGFNLVRTVSPESFEDFVDLVVPVLQERGLFKADYAQGTLRRKLFGRDHLPERHGEAPVGAP